MLEEIKKDIRIYLLNEEFYDIKNIKNNISNIILNKSNDYNFFIICDDTNNYTYTVSEGYFNVDIYYKERSASEPYTYGLTNVYSITTHKNKNFFNNYNIIKKREKRKEKLNKIYNKKYVEHNTH